MASEGSDPDAEYALSRLLQRGTVADYQNEFEMVISRVAGKSESFLASIRIFGLKPTLIRALLWSNPTTLDPETPTKEVVDNDIKSEVVVCLPEEFQEEDMVDALLIIEQKGLGNWKELDNESGDRKVQRDAKKEGEPTILATFSSDRGITIWDPEIKTAFQDDTLRVRWFQKSEECYAPSLG
nr:hypothetical protein [Tanacetum cinerariifolium]